MIRKVLLLLATAVLVGGCSVRYTTSGASIDPAVKTASIIYFPNMAPLVAPTLSSTLTDALTEKIQNQTRLQIVREDGDVNFEGEIIGYTSAPIAISGDEYATKNRLTITVRVRFTNKVQPQFNYDKSFTSYADYETSQMLISIQDQLCTEICDLLVENIFNEALANW